jgi:hypothetical protein
VVYCGAGLGPPGRTHRAESISQKTHESVRLSAKSTTSPRGPGSSSLRPIRARASRPWATPSSLDSASGICRKSKSFACCSSVGVTISFCIESKSRSINCLAFDTFWESDLLRSVVNFELAMFETAAKRKLAKTNEVRVLGPGPRQIANGRQFHLAAVSGQLISSAIRRSIVLTRRSGHSGGGGARF